MRSCHFAHPMQLLMIFLIFIINLGTLYFCAPLKENLSFLGNALDHRLYLLLWAASASIYFFWFTRKLMHDFRYTHRLGWILLWISCIGMIASVCLPYAPLQYPEISKWHTRIAMWSTIGYILLFLHFLYDVMKKDYMFFMKGFPRYLFIIVFDSLLYLLNGGVSTLLEITFTMAMCCLLYYLRILQECDG